MLKRLINRLTGHGDAPASASTDEAGAPNAKYLLDAYVEEAVKLDSFQANYQQVPAAKQIAQCEPQTKVRILTDVLNQLKDVRGRVIVRVSDKRAMLGNVLQDLMSALIRANLPIDADTLDDLIQCGATWCGFSVIPSAGILRAVERYAENQPLSDDHRKQLAKLKSRLMREHDAGARQQCKRIDALLADSSAPGGAKGVELEAGEPWADALRRDLAAMAAAQRDAWQRLVNYAATARGSKPSAKWLKTANPLMDAIGRERFVQRLAEWFPLVGKPGVGRPVLGITGAQLEPTMLNEANADVLKGIVWAAANVNEPAVARLLGDVAEVCFKKIPNVGARCPKVANACLAALALMPGPEPVAQLSRIAAKAKKPSAQKLIEKALSTSAEKQGMSPEELEEMGVPDFGLDASGRRAVPVAGWTAEIELTPKRVVALRWRKAGAAKPQAAVPAEVKRDHADALKQVKRLVKDIERVLPTQVARVERLLLDDRSWPLEVWRQRYLDQPLLAPLGRRLVWQLDGATPITFIHHEGGLVDAAGARVEPPSGAQVRLWHPIRSSPDDVLAWRRFLESRGITQPFKQAHREIYVLTDAERQTRTYSNRFAGHVIRQHQFQALCDARGWSYHLMGGFDSHNVPNRVLRRQHMRVEFWVEAVEQRESDAGIFLHVSTDQVRFFEENELDPTPLERVPPAVFSEVMRDVDLFIGVCSVGNDPTWRDRGEQFGAYWQRYAFGDLSETALTRRDVLSRLLPRLKIADRASLEDRFLVVRGDLRTYKIHLGSSNIQVEPNNQYLCIVPDRRSLGEDVFLPFEGDHTLAVILSKAFLLADDRHIKDPSIVSQIRRG